MNHDLVTVILPVYNERIDWIEQSINSILGQTYKHLEIIIINDNPQNKEIELLLQKIAEKDKRIKIHRNTNNLGLPKSLNIGIDLAHGKFIARMDADDISFRQRIEKQVAYLNDHPNIGICGTGARKINENNKILKKIFLRKNDSELKAAMFFFCPFIHPTICARADILKRYKYNDNCKIGQDWELWIRMSENETFGNIQETLLFYRVHSNQSPVKAGEINSYKSRLYSSTIYANKLKLHGEIKDLYIKYYCNKDLTISELNELFLYFADKYKHSSTYKYVVYAYCIKVKDFGLSHFFKNPLFRSQPLSYLLAAARMYIGKLKSEI